MANSCYQNLNKAFSIEARWKPIICYFFCCLLPCIFSQANAQEAIPVFRHLNVENGLSNNDVQGIAQDDKGFFGFATQHGLNRYDGREIVHYLHFPTSHQCCQSLALIHIFHYIWHYFITCFILYKNTWLYFECLFQSIKNFQQPALSSFAIACWLPIIL